MKIRPEMQESYQTGLGNNTDLYGHAVYAYLERWAELMEKDIAESDDPVKAIAENAKKRSHEADTEGITGFMYGCAVSILSDCWEYGEILRKWHNNRYDYDGNGVVNPALLTIGLQK